VGVSAVITRLPHALQRFGRFNRRSVTPPARAWNECDRAMTNQAALNAIEDLLLEWPIEQLEAIEKLSGVVS